MDLARDEILKYLGDMQAHWLTYHNHKETSAWAGVVFFVAVLPLILGAFEKTMSKSIGARLIATALIVALGVGVVLYLREQLHLRHYASGLVAACAWLRADIISRPQARLDPSDYAPGKGGDGRVQASHLMAEAVLQKAGEMMTRGQGARRQLEAVAFGLVLVLGVIAVLRVWLVRDV